MRLNVCSYTLFVLFMRFELSWTSLLVMLLISEEHVLCVCCLVTWNHFKNDLLMYDYKSYVTY